MKTRFQGEDIANGVKTIVSGYIEDGGPIVIESITHEPVVKVERALTKIWFTLAGTENVDEALVDDYDETIALWANDRKFPVRYTYKPDEIYWVDGASVALIGKSDK